MVTISDFYCDLCIGVQVWPFYNEFYAKNGWTKH